MAIIYSYPLNDNIKSLDELVGTTEKTINGQLKTVTRNFLLQDLAEFFIVDGGLQKTIQLTTNNTSGPATLNQTTGVLNIPIYDQNFIIPAALTKTNDTNVTLTLGGSPSNALLQGVSLALGWTGTLNDDRITSSSVWNAKQNAITIGTSLQYLRGDLSLATFPTIPIVSPSALTKEDDVNITLTLGGTPATSLLQDVSLTLGWTGTLADGRITSASIWNAKQNAITTGTTLQYLRGDLSLATFPTNLSNFTNGPGYITSAALAPYITTVTAAATYEPKITAGTTDQYWRGDKTWQPFPSIGGGGSTVNYYLNGGTPQGIIGGVTYYEFSKTAVIGTGADFSRGTNGLIASFITDVADPSSLLIPGGNWNLEFFFHSSSNGGTPSFYVELYKYNGTTFTLIASNSTNPEGITGGTAIDAYFTPLAVPETVLTVNDRLAIRVFVTTSGKTITLHTQNGHLCEVITTFTAGLTALNGLQAQVQNFATGTTGTNFAINSSGSTHTFNLPDAGTVARGVVTINNQSFAGLKTFTDNIIVNGININRGNNDAVANIAIGLDTLDNTSGNQNTVIGYQAASNDNITPLALSFNTVLGYQAYGNGAANNNTAIGWQSLFSSEANNNSALGYSSGLLLTTGFQNTFIGAFAGGFTGQKIDAQNSTAIGYNAISTKNNQIVLGNGLVVETVIRGTTLVDGGVFNVVDSLIVGGPVKSTQYKLTALNTAPASATAAGTLGDIRITTGFIYVCIATNTWVRAPLATW